MDIVVGQEFSVGNELFALMPLLLESLLDHVEDVVHLLGHVFIGEVSVGIQEIRERLEGAIKFSAEFLDLLEVVSELDAVFEGLFEAFIAVLEIVEVAAVIGVELVDSV